MRNVPDDWDLYWTRCDRCGRSYHQSEGGCECWEEHCEREQQKQAEELLDLLSDCVVEELIVGKAGQDFAGGDALGNALQKGSPEFLIYVVKPDGEADEYSFSTQSWEAVKKRIDLSTLNTPASKVAKR